MSDWPIILNAQLVHGQLKLNRRKLELLLKSRRDCELAVIIERKTATRSLAQNNWYWSGIIGSISDYTGYTPEETHEFCKAKFLPNKITLADKDGEVIEEIVIGTSTAKLNKIQFGEYIDSIRQWAAETLDLDIKDPLPLEMVS